ncbi:MAG: hypothetical protein ABIP17_07075 [Ilumatobacteraceae bacterium]
MTTGAVDDFASRGRIRWLSVAAAVLVVAAMGSMALFARSDPDPFAALEVDLSGATPLAGAERVEPSDWVVAAELPDGVGWLYADTDDEAPSLTGESERAVWYGDSPLADARDRYRVSVGGRSLSSGGDAIDIDGTAWTISPYELNRWIATRPVGPSFVAVSGPGVFDVVDRDLIASLVVVPESGLPATPLGPVDQSVVVAQTELGETSYTLAAQESNGFWCFAGRSTNEFGYGCGTAIDPADPITIETGSTTSLYSADTVKAVRGGTVATQVARVDVEFVDGTIVSVTPTDLSAQFDRRFWIAAADIDTQTQPGSLVTVETVVEVRAYDNDGRLLAAKSPPSPNEQAPG